MATRSGGSKDSDRASTAGELERELSSVRFAAVARRASEAARDLGLDPPAFRSPPRSPGVRRSIRRGPDGSATVSVTLRGRPGIAVIGDMIDGIVLAAELSGVEAGLIRDHLWAAVAGLLDEELESGSEPLLTKRAA